MAKVENYDASSIQVLEGLEAVRKRPGMYIGSTDSRGLHHLVYEIVDNSIDEALAGFGTEIKVIIHKDNSITVIDHGRGVPTGMHETGKSTPEVIFTVLHAGGKFGQGGYKTSGGLHGVGSSVVNALSEYMEVEIRRDGVISYIRFENGGHTAVPLETRGKCAKSDTGTITRFKPDASMFSTTDFNFQLIAERLRESAFLISGLKMIIIDERQDKEEIFQYENGLESFVDFLKQDKGIIGSIYTMTGESSTIEVDFACAFSDGYNETFLSFVNNVRTRDGGTHETGAKSAITKVVNDYARKYALIKEKDKNLEGADVREGIIGIVSVRIPEELLQFESQTKSKLGTPQARGAVDAVINEKLMFVLEENKELATSIVKKAQKAQMAREAARKAREDIRLGKQKGKKDALLSGKLTPAQSKDKTKNELFLVEGDSAGGSAKQGRDRKFQAILPLRGKVVNTERAKLADAMKNEEINTIIHTIGAGLGADFNLANCNYDKIIIMTDADTDGAHIQTLLLTFFFRYMRELVEAEKVYLALPPLYKVSKGIGKKEVIEYAWTDEDLSGAIEKIGRGYTIQRYKGLGEMNADQLWDTTMNPETRVLIQVGIDDATDADKNVSILMGDKVEPRRDWIENNVDFTIDDNFEIN
ncbi:DNA topoisomerase IV subunit B [Culicoidibacter larvae]|uniref:DNA topoisomerase 4 subunit B n=1 Tax=Culicoidibacter larvae TaxID=2579976 RepID=A0A5R8QCB7_9FIRM|nr:DNA topoisomerase IV subunit B [Culicoidibacter larvae]TLG72958.1 DNA topoisomerase IV subunit B [Culicoidibacter larvae]